MTSSSQGNIPGQELPIRLTPAVPSKPRINGASVFGVRPGSEFLYTIPASGERPMAFSAEGLPAGLELDARAGRIIGRVDQPGEHAVVLGASNSKGAAEKRFRIVVGERIALTPPMGWNSWNCWADSVDQGKVLRSARAMLASGLLDHGWCYINIDDGWQGQRGGPFQAIQGNEKFPDLKALCAEIHGLGLKAGIYSTPWVTSFAKYTGGSSDDPAGAWSKDLAQEKHWRHGRHLFVENDAKQWAEWGIDYLKFDWHPIDVPRAAAMARALRKTNRDILLSLSNLGAREHPAKFAELANCWRTAGDIWDQWSEKPDNVLNFGVSEIAFSQDPWAPYSGPGHWNDPDMLVVGQLGWGPKLHATRLTPDEQYSHISMWCMLAAPLLLGCDLERLDTFTLGLLTNDEVLAIDQDPLGKAATRVATVRAVDVFQKDLADGSRVLGFFNRSQVVEEVRFNKLFCIGLKGAYHVRDLWRQMDLPEAEGTLNLSIQPHGVVLLKLTDCDTSGKQAYQ
jgi:alpha-galactosidase